MSLNPAPNNPFGSFSWLSHFIKVVAKITKDQYAGFSCNPYVTQTIKTSQGPAQRGLLQASGIYTNGGYWLGFYYILSSKTQPNAKGLPWFGCLFSSNFDPLAICILVQEMDCKGARANNTNLLSHLKHLVAQSSSLFSWSKEFDGYAYYFQDYMKTKKPTGFSNLSDWMCSSTTQEADLRAYFETANNCLAPLITA